MSCDLVENYIYRECLIKVTLALNAYYGTVARKEEVARLQVKVADRYEEQRTRHSLSLSLDRKGLYENRPGRRLLQIGGSGGIDIIH